MKLLIALVVTFTLWPIIVFGGTDLKEYDDSTTSFPDLCANDTIHLSNQKSLIFREKFFSSRSVKCIDIKNTRLDITAGSFDGVPNLMYLDIRGNFIGPESSNLFAFGSLSNVRVLRLGGVRFRYDDYGYRDQDVSIVVEGEYPQLQYLDISNITIGGTTMLSGNPFPKLTHLDMSRIHSFTSMISFLPYLHTLMHLDLSNNGLSDLRLPGMGTLLTLILDGNNFVDIGQGEDSELDLRGLPNLVNLSVANNRISYIDETAFKDTVYLRHLNLSMNYLHSFNSEVFSHLNFLEVLVLDSNSLETVSFDKQLNITMLSLNCNNIKNLSTNFYLPRLEKLFLNSNKISYLSPQTFQNLVHLSELHLSDNQLDYISKSIWNHLKKLQYLALSGNAFTTLSYLVNCTANRITFDRNPLGYINTTELSALPRNMLISLNGGMVPQRNLCPLKLRQSDTSDVRSS